MKFRKKKRLHSRAGFCERLVMENTERGCEYEALRLDRQLCFPLYSAARKVTSAYTPFLKPLGLTYTQYIALMALWEKDDVLVKELCGRLYLDNGTVTPVLKHLEKAGLVKRIRSEKDERCVWIRLTEEGWRMRERAKEIPRKVGACFAGISPGEAEELYRSLYKILGRA